MERGNLRLHRGDINVVILTLDGDYTSDQIYFTIKKSRNPVTLPRLVDLSSTDGIVMSYSAETSKTTFTITIPKGDLASEPNDSGSSTASLVWDLVKDENETIYGGAVRLDGDVRTPYDGLPSSETDLRYVLVDTSSFNDKDFIVFDDGNLVNVSNAEAKQILDIRIGSVVPAWYDSSVPSLRIFVDPTNGSDVTGDGTTWAKALKSLTKVAEEIKSLSFSGTIGINIPAGEVVESAWFEHITSRHLDIVAVVDGTTHSWFTNSGERTSFGTTALEIRSSDDNLFHFMDIQANVQIKALIVTGDYDTPVEEFCWGMIELTTSGGTSYNVLLHLSNVISELEVAGAIFTMPSPFNRTFIGWWNAIAQVSLLQCHFVGEGGTGVWRGILMGTNGRLILESSTKTWHTSYPCPFTESMKITDTIQLLSTNGVDNHPDRSTFVVGGIDLSEAGNLGKPKILIGGNSQSRISIQDHPSTDFEIEYDSVKSDSTLSFSDVDIKTIDVGLPTSDPLIAGARWNDSGVIKVSAG